MKNVLFASVILGLIASTTFVNAQDQGADAAAAQAAFLESLKLVPEHAYLKKHLGKWTTEMKTYFEDPSNPTVAAGSATFTELFGGRYVRQEYKGAFAGLPFEGIGVTGFDKTKKKYVSTWVDNFETGILTMEGTYDEKTSTLTEVGTSHTPEGEMKMKNVTKDIDKDTMVFSMYMVQPDGKENLGLQITYRRVK